MKIYNSLTRKKEDFIPLKEGHVGIYVCGPTVYDEPHIGHARSAYVFDVIRRYFAYKGYSVKFVRNVTDVDDKIIEKAREVTRHPAHGARGGAGKSQVTPPTGQEAGQASLVETTNEIAKKYLDMYHEDMGSLGIGSPDKEPKATEYIPKMVKFIELLIEKGAAYESDGDVYFDIKKAKDYGKLSNQNLDKVEAGSRKLSGEKKKDYLDFALWKKAKSLEPSWPSPWGEGRPGWHIECSAMSSDILGNEFDIHGGGIDLIFPHHENEIAQSEGVGKKFARYWVHNGLLTINGEKMAKSLGNFITIKDFLSHYKDPDYLKLLFLSTHYRHPVDYTAEKIEDMKAQKERFSILLDTIDRKLSAFSSQLSAKKEEEIEKIKENFINAMDDDFNMPQGLSSMFELVSITNKNIDNLNFISEAKKLLFELSNVFELDLTTKDDVKNLSARITVLIEKRNKARKSGDFKEADKIRKGLEGEGIILEDTKDGTVWRRKI